MEVNGGVPHPPHIGLKLKCSEMVLTVTHSVGSNIAPLHGNRRQDINVNSNIYILFSFFLSHVYHTIKR